MGKELKPSKLVPNYSGRKVGAFKCAIPPRTIEPPQIHLIASRDNHPFQELIIPQDKTLLVAYFDVKSMKYHTQAYKPETKVIIPSFKIHWLINPSYSPLNFICEYAPHPWDGNNDEPEFPNLSALMQFAQEKGLMEKLRKC
jgi:hypothetical protein